MDYRNIFNGIARKQLVKNAQFPNKNLGVENDEFKDGIPLMVYNNIAKQPTKYAADSQTAVEKVTPDLQGGTGITGDNAPDYYFGDVLS